jgi:hypothetical protein
MTLENLTRVYRYADADDRREGKLAYQRYNLTMCTFADKYEFGLDRVVAAFVALSPNNDYHGNLRSLASVLDGIDKGVPLEQITVTTYNHGRDRAYAYLQGTEKFVSPDRGLKTLAFYHNILDPDGTEYVTIDGHMVCAYEGFDKTMTEAAVRSRKHYYEIAAAVKAIAFADMLVPCEVQAITWFARKRKLGIKYTPQLSLFADPTDKWNTGLDARDVKPYPTKGALNGD